MAAFLVKSPFPVLVFKAYYTMVAPPGYLNLSPAKGLIPGKDEWVRFYV